MNDTCTASIAFAKVARPSAGPVDGVRDNEALITQHLGVF